MMVYRLPSAQREYNKELLSTANYWGLPGYATRNKVFCNPWYDIRLLSKNGRQDDRHTTVLSTRYGLFEHTRMGIRLCNAPDTFQRAMQLVLRGLTWTSVLVYLGDVEVQGSDFESCLRNLREAYCRFWQYKPEAKAQEVCIVPKRSRVPWKNC